MRFLYSMILLITFNQLLAIQVTSAQTIYLDSIAVIEAPNVSDTVIISLMVKQQIEQAKINRESELKNINENRDSITQAGQNQQLIENDDSTILAEQFLFNGLNVENSNPPAVITGESKDHSGFDLKLAVLSGAAIAAFGFVSFRRIKLNKTTGLKTLKKNINLMREEKFVVTANKRISRLRSELRKNPEYLVVKDKSVSKTAKDLNIAKGELMLAAKIHSFELSKSCSPRL